MIKYEGLHYDFDFDDTLHTHCDAYQQFACVNISMAIRG